MTLPIGVCLPTEAMSSWEVRRCILAIDRSGADHLAVGEHVLSPNPTPSVFTTLSFAAGITESVDLVSAVALAPLYPAGLLAKLSVTLDDLSDGRFVLGVGVGGEHPDEFAACGIDVTTRGRRTDESLAALGGLSDPSAGSVDLVTKSFELRGAALNPPPRRPVPVWVAGRRNAAIERAARFGQAWYPYLVDAVQLRRGAAALRDASRRLGRPSPGITAYCYVRVGDGGTVGVRADAAAFLSHRYSLDPTVAARYVIAGDAATCAGQLDAMVDAGATRITARLACGFDEFDAMLARLMGKVAPRVASPVLGADGDDRPGGGDQPPRS